MGTKPGQHRDEKPGRVVHKSSPEVRRGVQAAPRSGQPDMSEAEAVAKFRKACALLGEISKTSPFQFYVASDVLHLMRGPSHDERCRAQQQNVVDSDYSIRISGGDW